MNDLLHFLAERGHAPECTNAEGLSAEAKKGVISGYIGFDPTADSFHIGNMAQVMFLRRLQLAGHKPLVLFGGATGKVGDPSGRDETRQLMTFDTIKNNIESQKRGISRLIRFDDTATGAEAINNADWLDGIGYIDMLREVGPHFTINRMLTMDSVKARLEREQPLTFLEFNYMIMQGYDFMHLRKTRNCILQMGGMDQLGNIIQGIELGRRMHGFELYGMVQPLLTTASGAKMGKSVGGAVWINADRKSSYDFWQYWRNVEDGDVGRWLRLFTDLPIDEVKRLEALKDREINDAKKILATEVTALVHGREAAEDAAKTAQTTFEQGALGTDLKQIAMTSADVSVVDMVVNAGFATSKGEAKKLILGGGIRINDEKVTDVAHPFRQYVPAATGEVKFSKGQKVVVKVSVA